MQRHDDDDDDDDDDENFRALICALFSRVFQNLASFWLSSQITWRVQFDKIMFSESLAQNI